jgi:hypothetical protein
LTELTRVKQFKCHAIDDSCYNNGRLFIVGTDVASLMEESKLLVLLAKIHQKTSNTEEYLKVLMNAKDVQIRYDCKKIIILSV